MFPMFIAEGENVQVEIGSMPGIFRRPIDLTVKGAKNYIFRYSRLTFKRLAKI
jgi:delta-aminolevulinic acid dehydratase/porphobilinogen synthase